MFRTVKFLFHISTLLFTVYLIEYTPLTTMVAVGVAVLLITGPEGLEAHLARQGYIAGATTDDDDASNENGGSTDL
jgi:hypothetical protein